MYILSTYLLIKMNLHQNLTVSALILFLILQVAKCAIFEDSNSTSEDYEAGLRVLSRRKRFLTFPEGASLQLVFCLTYPVLVSIGDIMLWGYTSALAFELPQDPYSPFDHHADPLHRRMDTKTIYYTDEDGRVMHKRPYKKKFIVNPAFAKRSVDSRSVEAQFKNVGKTEPEFKIDRKQMHASNTRDFLKGEQLGRAVEFHRSSRSELYSKIETMLQGLGGNGKQCMLKTLCLVGQTQRHPQGGFLQEILRAVFTLPKGHSDDEVNQEYDEAHWATELCDNLYPECSEPLSFEKSKTNSY